MAVTWKGSMPILAWFFVFALLKWAKVETTGFLGGFLIGVGWFLLIPVLSEAGVAKSAHQWIQKAGLWAIFSAAFGLVALTLLKDSGAWHTWLVDFGLLASGFFGFLGALIGFFKWK
ncbi:hypothetical protein DRJ48_03355 [Candidatus Woesearchaeota archaeon]|nr:hypothetical protein [Candidatus Woesearchaeota archaeon]RLE42516.1 MAG: hypothetical protein DRJ48_03355 [Candidatus Woesearchaeota archaeon]